MKFSVATPSLVLSLLAVVSAQSTNSLGPRAGSCPLDVLSCEVHTGNVDPCCVPEHGLLVHSQQWHPELGPNDTFTMHGLWPNDCDGTHSNSVGCDPSREYPDVEDILKHYSGQRAGFMNDMNEYWPSYMPSPTRPNNNAFWVHEWNKHGTCVSTLGPDCMDKDDAVYSYFDKGLQLREEYDIYAALASHNITPGQTRYSVDDIISAIEEELHVGAAVWCKHGREPMEIHLFFQVENRDQYKPVMRPSAVEKTQYCRSGMVYYPKKST